MEYEKPFVTDLGSISRHTWQVGRPGHYKGGGEIWHYDKHCEMSGCSSANDPDCVDLCDPDAQAFETLIRGRSRGN